MDEFEIIKYFQSLSNGCNAADGFIDDVAKIDLLKNESLVLSKDIIVEDIHFLRSYGGYKIASKLLRSNLSDIASAGAKPLYYMLGFTKNAFTDEDFIKEFTRGLKGVQDEFGLTLIGGDTVKTSDKLFFSITIFGSLNSLASLSRKNARDGDLIFTSGNIGDAYLGLRLSNNETSCDNQKYKNYLLDRHFFPTPRVTLGENLLNLRLSSCATDISDGLLADTKNICQASLLKASLFVDKVPISVAADYVLKKNPQIRITDLLSAGDDYELVFTCSKEKKEDLLKLANKLLVKVTQIGYFTTQTDKDENLLSLFDKNNILITPNKLGYRH